MQVCVLCALSSTPCSRMCVSYPDLRMVHLDTDSYLLKHSCNELLCQGHDALGICERQLHVKLRELRSMAGLSVAHEQGSNSTAAWPWG